MQVRKLTGSLCLFLFAPTVWTYHCNSSLCLFLFAPTVDLSLLQLKSSRSKIEERNPINQKHNKCAVYRATDSIKGIPNHLVEER